MSFRKTLFWAHLVAGIVAGCFILLMSTTGVLLTYEAQIQHWADRSDIVVQDARLSADQLADIAIIETQDQASTLVFSNAPDAAVLATSGRDGKLYINPYSGAVLGSGSDSVAGFFHSVTALHRWLSLTGSTQIGGALVSASNLVFLFLLITGIYLWLPRLWKWGMIKTRVFLRRSYPNAKARDFAWHHVFGIWAIIPLFVIVISGVVISYPWASNAIYAAYGETAPAGRGRPGTTVQTGPLAVHSSDSLQKALEIAMAQTDDWNRITLTLPRGEGTPPIMAMIDSGTGRQWPQQETLQIAQADSAIIATTGFDDLTPATQTRIWMRFVHTGEFYGLIGQTIAGLASLAAAISVYTGLALSYRRLIQPILRRRSNS